MSLTLTPLGTVAPYPKGNKNCPGYLIEYGNYRVLFDCGNGCTRLLKFPDDLNNLVIFISHLHPDHVGDLVSLLQTIMVYRRYGYVNSKIHLYLPETLEEQKEYYEDEMGWMVSSTVEKDAVDYEYIKKYAKKADVEMHLIGNKVDFMDFSIDNKSVVHSIKSYAFRFDSSEGSITYSGDTGMCNSIQNLAKDSDLFICESTFLKGQQRMQNHHLYAYEAAEIAKNANTKQLLLTHFWPETDKNLYKEEASKIFNNVDVACEGKKLVLRR